MAKATPKKNTEKKVIEALSAPVYTSAGKEAGTIALPGALFNVAWNNDLVRQVALGMQSNARAGNGLAHTKGRGEVRGGGKKPWKQKGTGQARHGSSRSPIWKGGGVTHGPNANKDYSKRIPKSMRAKALAVVLSQKLREGEVIFVDSISFKAPKTAEARTMLKTFAGIKGFEMITSKKTNAVFIALSQNDENTKRSFGNFGNVEVDELRNLNVVDALSSKYLLIENPEASLKLFEPKTK
jgi:large subunit ribosomal protein L4